MNENLKSKQKIYRSANLSKKDKQTKIVNNENND